MGCKNILKSSWRYLVIICAPLALVPLLTQFDAKEARCAYAMLLMAIYWMTESLPLPVTALMPMVLFPLMGVVPAKKLALNYFKDTIALFVGGLMLAVSIEKSNLHKRIAIGVLKLMGVKPFMLTLGFMLPTWFLSMWISNTATTAMMVPVANAVLLQLKRGFDDKDELANNQENLELSKIHHNKYKESKNINDMEQAANDKEYRNVCKCLTLCVAYAANVGGTGTLTGTGPNLVLKNTVDDLYKELGRPSPISFLSWMAFGLPGAAIAVVVIWLWLTLLFLGPKSFVGKSKGMTGNTDGIKAVIDEEYKKLGKIRFAEIANVLFFCLLVALWLTRNPGIFTGWGSFFKDGYVTDSTPAMLIGVLLFVIPSELPQRFCSGDNKGSAKIPTLMDWQTMHQKMPWSVVLLLGGGFALADAAQKSGLSSLVGRQLGGLGVLPPWVIVLTIATLTAVMTEMTANTPTSQLLLPILAELAAELQLHPLYLMLPCAVAASFAFCLPVATPPNAIVFSYGHLRVIDMVKCGLVLNILCILIVTMGAHTWGEAFFHFSENKPWNVTNAGLTTPQTSI